MLISSFNCFSVLATELAFLQQFCLNLAPQDPSSQDVWKALVCGTPLSSQAPLQSDLKSAGLIHVFVVSGSHFLVIESLLSWVSVPSHLRSCLLWGYNAWTGFSAPGVRACLNLTFKNWIQAPPEQRQWVLSLLCLGLQPAWATSLSFWLSWLASLVLVMSPDDWNGIWRQLLFFVTWILLGFQISWISIPANLLLAPLISWVLFPLAFLALISPLDFLFSRAHQALETVLNHLPLDSASSQFPAALPQLVSLTLLIHFSLHYKRLRIKGKRIR